MVSFVKPQTIVLLAAEPSADALGAELAMMLRQLFPDVHLLGMAGSRMRQAGVEARWQMEDVAVMGLWEVLKHYPRLRRLQKTIIAELLELRPSFVLGIDGPDFNLPIEAYLKSHSIPVYHFVAPTVWAWRESRAVKLAKQTDGVLCLFPFEPPYFLLHGLRAKAVGHPLAERLPLYPNKLEARQKLGVSESMKTLAVLPGSRAGEWRYHAEVFFQTVAILSQQYPELQVLVPCLNAKMQEYLKPLISNLPIQLILAPNGASEVLTASDLALVVSGTATLETALCHTPMIIAYRMHPVSWFIISKLAKTSWAGLPNILANASIVPEYLQDAMQPADLAMALSHLFETPATRERQLGWFTQIHQLLNTNTVETSVETLLEWWQDDIRQR